MLTKQQEAALADILAMLETTDQLEPGDCIAVHLRHYPKPMHPHLRRGKTEDLASSLEAASFVRCEWSASGRLVAVKRRNG